MDDDSAKNIENIDQELSEIKSLLQSILIIQGSSAGLTRDQVRELAGVSTKRVSDIWSDLKKKNGN